ncbi:nitrous oxide reductase accessory protein NosL [Azospirillum fermentarium]|uniref:nitrous oxide reductase accessory protein NosL n=1 Tax=Azospirillum fermentarium TaxID=1233114 RepID=UPI002226087F|nr:nitrous oxide reductase accessory protein NosL [Azospirillum fermentarium]MCW2248974.1 nitrous oxide reductase accessory protein NosL [Azospirillum fermentarium]
MRTLLKATLLAAAVLLPLAACQQKTAEAPPPPQAIAADAVGRYCGMNLMDHPGPKGQVILKGTDKPVWLSSVRDALAFTALPEEPKDYRAVYVTDLARAADPRNPDLSAWVEARQAWFVLNSGQTGGMGEAETLPFADEGAARRFAAAHGGTVKRFTDLTVEEILMPGQPESAVSEDDGHGAGHSADPHSGGHGPKGAL